MTDKETKDKMNLPAASCGELQVKYKLSLTGPSKDEAMAFGAGLQ
jgi:hypothetical protein